jgi:hypothetical protein
MYVLCEGVVSKLVWCNCSQGGRGSACNEEMFGKQDCLSCDELSQCKFCLYVMCILEYML